MCIHVYYDAFIMTEFIMIGSLQSEILNWLFY